MRHAGYIGYVGDVVHRGRVGGAGEPGGRRTLIMEPLDGVWDEFVMSVVM